MKENFFDKFKTPIPPHLTPEEREKWEEDYEWEQQERERRKKEGFYDEKPRKKSKGWKLIQKLFKRN
jgi:hypothetical protein